MPGKETKPESTKKSDYFKLARSWASDKNTQLVLSRNRYRFAFFASMGLTAISLLTLLFLANNQHIQLVVVHEGKSGYVWLSSPKQKRKIKPNWERAQAEIAHYVIARESYDPVLYLQQSEEVKLLSSFEIAQEYEISQDKNNKSSAINLLAAKGYRTVVINNILNLSTKDKNNPKRDKNLAQVDFTVTDHLFGETQKISTPETALVSWRYAGTPNNPSLIFSDWDGFKITKYVTQVVNSTH